MIINWLKDCLKRKPKKAARVKMYSEIVFEKIDVPAYDYTEFYKNTSKKEESKES